MNEYDEWAARALEKLVPRTAPDQRPLHEVAALVRAAYVEGYIDRLSGNNEIMDPCAAERHLALSIPIP